MKKTIFSLMGCLIVIGITVPALGKDLTELTMNNGRNCISLSITNSCQSNVHGVTVSWDKEKLPSWLEIGYTPKSLDIPGGGIARGEVQLTINVTDAPVNANALLPFTITDVSGHTWKYSLPVKVNESAPIAYALHQNYPNPFNPTTTIQYSLKELHNTSLVIYNLLGQKVRILVHKQEGPGIHSVQWDGKNDNGEQVSSGVYFYKLKSGTFVESKRMLLLE
jgi:hypothetical protein